MEMLTTWRVDELVPLEPFTFTDQGAERRFDEYIAETVGRYHDSAISAPLWHWGPEFRPAVMHERRRRFPGIFETDEVDPEFS